MASDGRLWFSTKIDNSQVAKDLKEVERQIRSSQEKISKTESKRLPLVKQAQELGGALDEAKAKTEALKKELATMKMAKEGQDPIAAIEANTRIPELEQELKASQAETQKLQKQWDTVQDKVEAYDREIQKANEDISRATEKAAELNTQLMTPSQMKTAQALQKAEKAATRFNRRLWEIGKSALIFNLVSTGLRKMVSYMGTALKTNAQYNAQLAQLKGAWMTAFQPIYEFVLPGLLAIMRVLTAIGNALANVLSFFGGKTATQSAKNAQDLQKQAGAIGDVGDAAKEAQKQLLGFDEINRLESPDTAAAGGGGGGGGNGTIEPDFSGITDMQDDLMQILGLVAAIAAGLLTWKIASMFTDSLSLAAGLGIAVAGALLMAFNWADAFANGIDWDNLSGMLLGMIGIVAGLALAFGSTGAAVGLLVGGIALVVLALYEWITTGELSTEACTALVLGIMAIGTAISIFTGSWIPLLVAGIASAVVLIAKNWDTLKEHAMAVWESIRAYFAETFADGFIHGLATMVEDAVMLLWNFFIDFINSLIENWNSIWGSIFSYQTTGSIQPAAAAAYMPETNARNIPALASGAVLPANKPFLAMVGDQRNGTNVEAPLETIKQALAEVMAQYGGGNVEVVFTGDLAALGRVLAPVVSKAQRDNDRGKGR